MSTEELMAAHDIARALYEREVTQRILALREDLMRHDENAKALALMEDCVPFFLQENPAIVQARGRTRRQSGHVRNPEAYATYYETNAHERPFEEQYGLSVEEAHRLPRIAFLRGALAELQPEPPNTLQVLDLAGNDGFLAANLASLPFPVQVDLCDLHPGNIALARKRAKTYKTIRSAEVAAAEDAQDVEPFLGRIYDAVVAFEVIEHVADPQKLLEAMLPLTSRAGRLFVSTPCGVDHGGDLPGWDEDEPKGHVRVFTEATFRAELERVGEVEHFFMGPDRVMVAQVRPSG
jgi:2-polyprenyl-3-methyl-5-hydroxy-6-metoxy-1,4-benzoquinol methylase